MSPYETKLSKDSKKIYIYVVFPLNINLCYLLTKIEALKHFEIVFRS